MTEEYKRACQAEYEARNILMGQGFMVSRGYGKPRPPDLFAYRKNEFILIMVRSSRRPVPDAHTVSILYGEDLDRFRAACPPGYVRHECWVRAPPDGWKFYEVYPGGLRRIRRDWAVPDPAGDPGLADPDVTGTGGTAARQERTGTGVLQSQQDPAVTRVMKAVEALPRERAAIPVPGLQQERTRTRILQNPLDPAVTNLLEAVEDLRGTQMQERPREPAAIPVFGPQQELTRMPAPSPDGTGSTGIQQEGIVPVETRVNGHA